MTNSILTPTAVTRAALIILHQKLNFIKTINRQYDDQFAKSGAKIGATLKIRLPNQFTVRSGATFTTQAVSETSTTLTVATQKGIDTEWTSAEMTMSLQDFSARILEPAMSQLAASMESDALSMINDVYQTVDNTTNASVSFATIAEAQKLLTDALAPADDRSAVITTRDRVDFVNAVKGLFQDSTAIKEQYKEGMIGRTSGFDFYENTLLTNLTGGTMSATNVTAVTDTIATATPQSTINVGNSLVAGTLVVGDVFTIATLNRVHPETKNDTGQLQQFVVTTASTMHTAASIAFSPSITMSGARQNVIATAISGQLINKIGNTSRSLRQSLFYHRDAFTFVSADLIMPEGVHKAAREVQDNLSMRFVQFYVGSTDTFGTRLDVLYGFKTIRPELAAKSSS